MWKFTPWFPPEVDLTRLIQHCSVVDGGALVQRGHSFGEFKGTFPVIQLKLMLEKFDVDCFQWESSMFVSARLRQAMALDPAAIEFFEVDSSQSAPLPRSKNYMLMNVPVVEDVSDASRSEYMSRELAPGVSVQYNVHSVAFRKDAAPMHQLFHDLNFRGYIFCTDDLAMRVLKAGCTGIRFLDPAQLGVAKPMRFRTLRGLEQGGWDDARKAERTELVEPLP